MQKKKNITITNVLFFWFKKKSIQTFFKELKCLKSNKPRNEESFQGKLFVLKRKKSLFRECIFAYYDEITRNKKIELLLM